MPKEIGNIYVYSAQDCQQYKGHNTDSRQREGERNGETEINAETHLQVTSPSWHNQHWFCIMRFFIIIFAFYIVLLIALFNSVCYYFHLQSVILTAVEAVRLKELVIATLSVTAAILWSPITSSLGEQITLAPVRYTLIYWVSRKWC